MQKPLVLTMIVPAVLAACGGQSASAARAVAQASPIAAASPTAVAASPPAAVTASPVVLTAKLVPESGSKVTGTARVTTAGGEHRRDDHGQYQWLLHSSCPRNWMSLHQAPEADRPAFGRIAFTVERRPRGWAVATGSGQMSGSVKCNRERWCRRDSGLRPIGQTPGTICVSARAR